MPKSDISNLYKKLSPSELEQLFRKNQELTRRGLEKLLYEHPDHFVKTVPLAIDGQTGLYSKLYFEGELLHYLLQKADTNKDRLSYLLLDLDDFKKFNSLYGYAQGDKAIHEFSSLLKKSFRKGERRETATQIDSKRKSKGRRNELFSLDYRASMLDLDSLHGRIGGGEEFGVILYGADERGSVTAATVFLKKVREIEIPYRSKKLGITASGGIAQYEEGMSVNDLRKNAEIALKYSKANGKDRLTPYSQVPENFKNPINFIYRKE